MARDYRGALAAPALLLLAFGCSSVDAPTGSPASSSATSGGGSSVGGAGSSTTASSSSSVASTSATSGTGGASGGASGSSGAGTTTGTGGTGGGTSNDASAGSDAPAEATPSLDASAEGGGGGVSDAAGACPGGGKICWDFETGRTPTGWAPVTNQGTGSIAVDNTKAHGGTYALHVKGSGSNPMHSFGQTLPANFGGTMWGRAFMFLSPSGPPDHGATFKARYADATDTTFGPDKLDWYEVGLGHGTYETIWHKPQPPSGLPEWEMISNTPVTLNQWFCEEWLFDGVNGTNAEAAEPRMFINGTELNFPDKHIYPGGSPKPPFTKATNFILIEVGLIMYHPLSAATDLWIDDLVLGPTRIGCN